MSEFLPKEVRQGLEMARKRALRKASRLRVHTDDEIFPILRYWDDGFALDPANAPHLRGHVDIYDGSRHLYQCLIVASDLEGPEMKYEFKRSTSAVDAVPLDYERAADAPVALIGRS